MSDEPSPGYNASPTPSDGSTGSIGRLALVVEVVGGVDVAVGGDVGDVLDVCSAADVVVGAAR
jgi:hypothetical protein